jgi:alcohol dehydrogenase (cytochrome c)
MGSDLYTASLVALDPDTGTMKWYFQGSPHDTHDWDQAEPPVLFNADINGQPRKLVAQASRNGYFFVLDRTNGRAIVSKPFVPLNWALGVNSRGEPIPNPAKFPSDDGTMVSLAGGGATNWFPSSFDPQTGLFYVNTTEGYSIAYVQTNNTDAAGFAGRAITLASHGMLDALDYRNGALVWQHRYRTDTSEHAGILTTAGHLLFTGDAGGDLIAYDPAKGDMLWYFQQLGSVSNGPETYMLDGKQYLVVGAAGYLYAYALAPAARPAMPAR